jgi:hypothetical protein
MQVVTSRQSMESRIRCQARGKSSQAASVCRYHHASQAEDQVHTINMV